MEVRETYSIPGHHEDAAYGRADVHRFRCDPTFDNHIGTLEIRRTDRVHPVHTSPRHRDVDDRAQEQEQNHLGRATFHCNVQILLPTHTLALSLRGRGEFARWVRACAGTTDWPWR